MDETTNAVEVATPPSSMTPVASRRISALSSEETKVRLTLLTSLLAQTVGVRSNELVLKAWMAGTADCPLRWLDIAIDSAQNSSKWSPTIAELRARVASAVMQFLKYHRSGKRGPELTVDLDTLMKDAWNVDRYIAIGRAMEGLPPVRAPSLPPTLDELPDGWEARLHAEETRMRNGTPRPRQEGETF